MRKRPSMNVRYLPLREPPLLLLPPPLDREPELERPELPLETEPELRPLEEERPPLLPLNDEPLLLDDEPLLTRGVELDLRVEGRRTELEERALRVGERLTLERFEDPVTALLTLDPEDDLRTRRVTGRAVFFAASAVRDLPVPS